MKFIIALFFMVASLIAHSQENTFSKHLKVGMTFDLSNDKFNNVTGLGLYLEASKFINENLKLAARLEPTALANGVLVLPGGCTQEHPRYPGIPSCREGANFLTKGYFKADRLLGTTRYGGKGGRHQFYAGAQLLFLSHFRYVITSRAPGNWRDTRVWITNAGAGIRFGRMMGRFDLSASYNIVGGAFQNFAGFNLGYYVWRK